MHGLEDFLTIPLISQLVGINPLWGTSWLPKGIELAKISLRLELMATDQLTQRKI